MSNKGGFLIPQVISLRVRRWKHIPFFHKWIQVSFMEELLQIIREDKILHPKNCEEKK